MAIIKCPECGENVSDKAIMCPHCGYCAKDGEKANTKGKIAKSEREKLEDQVLIFASCIGPGVLFFVSFLVFSIINLSRGARDDGNAGNVLLGAFFLICCGVISFCISACIEKITQINKKLKDKDISK